MKNIYWKAAVFILLFSMLPFALISHGGSEKSPQKKMVSDNMQLSVATFAGGCFWCVESRFEKIEGVKSVISGYSGGTVKNPSYKQVSQQKTDHVEAVQVHYDENKVNYDKLLDAFWREIDPTDNGGQFVDRGPQYRPLIFSHSDQQQVAAEKSRSKLDVSGRFDKPVITEIVPFTVFYPAEEYHQDYHNKNPIRYKYYRYNSGRDQFLKKIWSVEMNSKVPEMSKTPQKYQKPSDDVIRKNLTPLQYTVTQNEGTERSFDNEYWDEKREGIYVDIVTGEPLFSSTDKYDSKSGWPSFTRPIEGVKITEKTDDTLFSTRTEVRSHFGDSHLGHVFGDGPAPTGQRYCINSASMRFIPKEEMKKEGYSDYLSLFK